MWGLLPVRPAKWGPRRQATSQLVRLELHRGSRRQCGPTHGVRRRGLAGAGKRCGSWKDFPEDLDAEVEPACQEGHDGARYVWPPYGGKWIQTDESTGFQRRVRPRGEWEEIEEVGRPAGLLPYECLHGREAAPRSGGEPRV